LATARGIHGQAAVVIDGKSGYGLRVSEERATDFGPQGEMGPATGIVRVSAADFNAPAAGATILVAGESVIVMAVTVSGGIIKIQYSKARPVQ